MRTTFFGLEIARSALTAQQRALDVTGHNIANANTPGYTRQAASMAANNPFTVPGLNKPTTPGQVGTGVRVVSIDRLRDQFVDMQVRTENKSMGYWEARANTMEKIETIVNEPSDASLRSVLDKFWEGWQELSKNPESVAVRSVVRQRGIALVETFNHLDRMYFDLQRDLDASIKVKVNEVNSFAQQIHDLNRQILSIEAGGDKANDLRDKRDFIIDKMSRIVDVNVVETELGIALVNIGGRAVVTNGGISKLEARDNPNQNGFVDVVWTDDKRLVSFTSGELQGLLESRGFSDPYTGEWKGIVPGMREDLDMMAKTLVEQTNKLHRGGYDLTGTQGINFFKPFEEGIYPPNGVSFASALKMDDAIMNSLNSIAAGTAPDKGDNGNALRIAGLKHKVLLDLTKGQSGLVSAQITEQSYASRKDPLTTVAYAPGVNLLGAGGLFDPTDFGPNASITVEQGGQAFTIDITDGLGNELLTGQGLITIDDLITHINNEALANGMQINAQLVEQPATSGNYFVELKASQALPGLEISIREDNFIGATNFGFHNPNNTGSVDDFYRSQIGKLGVAAQEANRMVENQQLLIDQLQRQRDQLSGVSLDEEMTNMIRFQHSYNAAARCVTVMDEMLDKIINGMGVTR